MEISPDGRYVAATLKEGKFVAWTLPGGKQVLNAPFEGPMSIMFSANTVIHVISKDDVRAWYVTTGKPFHQVRPRISNPTLPTPYCRTTEDGRIEVEAGKGGPVRLVLKPDGPVSAIDMSELGKYIAAATDKTVTLWDGKTGKVLEVLDRPGTKYLRFMFSEHESLILGGDYRTTERWSLNPLKRLK